MAREYRMQKRAEARDQVRERIVQATMRLHDEKGVVPTTFADIAERAGVGPATVSRHFPRLGDLVRACGAHVWQEMRPPTHDTIASSFAEAKTSRDRLVRLVEELDAFYARGAHRLALAARDRELVPELDGFLTAVEAGVKALVREALANTEDGEHVIQVAVALTSFQVWTQFTRVDLDPAELTRLKVKILECTLKAARNF
jgi:AcrR family transcriptional regulator